MGTVLTVFAFDANGGRRVEDMSSIPGLIADDGIVVWADLADAGNGHDEFEVLVREFGLHPLAVEDALKHGQRPKLEIYPNHAFIVSYACSSDVANLPEVDAFIGDDWIVTVRERAGNGVHFDVEAVRERFERTLGTGSVSSGFLLYVVLDEVVDTYFDGVDLIEERLEAVEDDIFAMSAAEESPIQRDMLDLRRDLLLLRRRIVPMRDVVLAILRREVTFVDEHALLYFQDVLDHLLRTTDQIDTLRELLGNAVDAHLAMVSNNMNAIMKKMTSWGAILLGATLVAGIYGMNFEQMPELRWSFGYPMALLTMLTLTGGLLVYFKRKGWL